MNRMLTARAQRLGTLQHPIDIISRQHIGKEHAVGHFVAMLLHQLCPLLPRRIRTHRPRLNERTKLKLDIEIARKLCQGFKIIRLNGVTRRRQ